MSLRDSQEQLREAIDRLAADSGLEVIECRVSTYGSRCMIRCLVDNPGGGITVEACASFNRAVVSFLEASSVFTGDYLVEVNSPGLDRQLRKPADFVRTKGKILCLWLSPAIADTEYIEGEILAVADEGLQVSFKGSVVAVPFSSIKVGKEKISM